MSSSEITDSLTETIQKDHHPLDLFVKKIVGHILNEYCIPWLVDCLQKYSEDDFHKHMSDSTWDFINDWETNHHKKFKAFITGARRLRYAYDFNSKAIAEQVVGILENNGWKVSETESVQLYFTMDNLRQMIEE